MADSSGTDPFARPPLRYRRFGGGYRKEDVEYALAELRVNLRQLDTDLEALRARARELEQQLQTARAEAEQHRTRELELSQTMAGVLRRADEIEEAAQERARSLIAAAEEAAQSARAEASRRVEETTGQFNEILRLKENLLGSMRGLVHEFGDALSRAERGEPLLGATAPAPHTPEFAGPAAFEPWPEPPAVSAVPLPPLAEPPPPPLEPAPAEPLFERHVELDVGPFPDFASLSTFERSLARLPSVEDVYVRRLADDRAVIELSLSEPTPLLAAMQESLPYDLRVQSQSASRLVVDVLTPSTAPS